MTKHITLKLTEDQTREIREWARQKRVERAQYILTTDRHDKPDKTLSFIKRIETTLAGELAKR